MRGKRKLKSASLLLALVVGISLLAGCNHTKKKDEEGKTVIPKVETLQNKLENMNIDGEVGDVLLRNETQWVHTFLERNPKLFAGFENPENPRVAKVWWHGEFPGKLLTGVAQTYRLRNDAKTKATGDALVSKMKAVQAKNGYLGPWPEATRFNKDVLADADALGKWDTWGQYHCIYGLYLWYQATGSKDALTVAKKALDCIYDYFIKGEQSIVSQKWGECNLAIGHAFALWYEATGEEKYLEAAERIVKVDWKDRYYDFYTKKVLSCDWLTAALDGKSYYQSNQPRWEGLHALETLSVLYRLTGEKDYATAMESLWWSMVGYDRHNTGSFGTAEGSTGDVYGLWSETCNTVAWMAFSTDYLKMSRDSYVADELELSFYNAALGSLLENGYDFTYKNDSNGAREASRVNLHDHVFDGGEDMSCCQANGNRGLTQPVEWAVLTEGEAIYLNYYGETELITQTDSGNRVTLKQETEYPKNGAVKITVSADGAFLLKLRIPVWSADTALTVNGVAAEAVKAGEYYEIKNCKNGDIVELDLDTSLHYWRSDSANVNYGLSVYSGPLLLAFRETDTLSATTRFRFSDVEAAERTAGEGLVNYRIKNYAGEEVVFTDYYTAGKTGKAYVSWISCLSDLEALTYEKGKTPLWCNRK